MKISTLMIKSVILTSVLGFLFSCTEQHDPRPHLEKMNKESDIANRAPLKLTEDGKIPVDTSGGEVVAVDPIDQKYTNFCSSCHGAAGDANSPVAQSLNPKPRDFTDAAWHAKVDDAHIAKVIKEGGASVGLSATMAAWGSLLSEEEVNGLVAKIRGFKK